MLGSSSQFEIWSVRTPNIPTFAISSAENEEKKKKFRQPEKNFISPNLKKQKQKMVHYSPKARRSESEKG